MNTVTNLLDSCGQFQTELNDLVFGGGEITDSCQGSPADKNKENKCNSSKSS